MSIHYIRSLWERFRWGFSLADLQVCVDAIFCKWDAVIHTLESSHSNRRHCIRMVDAQRAWLRRYFEQPSDDVKLTANPDLGNTVWIAYSKAHGKFYMLPRSREVGRLKEL